MDITWRQLAPRLYEARCNGVAGWGESATEAILSALAGYRFYCAE